MSINKKAQIRYLTLDKCLRNTGRLWTWKNLLDAVNEVLGEETNTKSNTPMRIAKTQLYEDLKDLEYRVYSAPIKKSSNGRTIYYSYEDPNFSIQNAPLNETELNQIKSTLQLLSRFQGLPNFAFIEELIPTIESKLGLVSLEKEVMSLESNLDYEGSKYIIPLFNAIVNKRSLSVEYKDFKSQLPYNIAFHPYYLKQYNNRWFVFGYNEFTKNKYWNMALDRIILIEESDSNYFESNIDWEFYFSDIIGVTKFNNLEPIELKLWFAPSQAPYIITKPIHESQPPIHKMISNENGIEFNIKVVPNYELEKLILSFGETVKVLSPISFQKIIANRIMLAKGLY
jgi:predicted DNA-binding transcriptional regulator YafY